MSKLMGKKIIYNFTLEIFVYLNLCLLMVFLLACILGLSSCSTQGSMKFVLLINVKMPTIVDESTIVAGMSLSCITELCP